MDADDRRDRPSRYRPLSLAGRGRGDDGATPRPPRDRPNPPERDREVHLPSERGTRADQTGRTRRGRRGNPAVGASPSGPSRNPSARRTRLSARMASRNGLPPRGPRRPRRARGAALPSPRVVACLALMLIAIIAGTAFACSQLRQREPAPPAGQAEPIGSASDPADETGADGADAARKGNEPSVEQQQAIDAARQDLDRAVAAIEDGGDQVSYLVLDLESGKTLEHNADTVYYSASSIKAPYCVSLVRELGDRARSEYGQTIADCLEASDNDAYETLRSAYEGQPFFTDFIAESGTSFRFAHWYAYYSPRQLAQLWRTAATWLESDDEDAQWLGGLLQDTLNSSVDDIAGAAGEAGGDEAGAVTTWSKAGWFSGDSTYDVTFDAGVVRAGAGDYAIAVATNRGADFDAIRSVMEPLVALWDAERAA